MPVAAHNLTLATHCTHGDPSHFFLPPAILGPKAVSPVGLAQGWLSQSACFFAKETPIFQATRASDTVSAVGHRKMYHSL